jgi:hypothetical protein
LWVEASTNTLYASRKFMRTDGRGLVLSRAGFELANFGIDESSDGIGVGLRARRRGGRRVLRNELAGTGDGSKAEALHLLMEGGFCLLFVAYGFFADDGAEALQFGECLIEAALSGGAVADREGEHGLIDVGIVKRREFEREGAFHAPLAEGHLIEEHTFGFGRGRPVAIEPCADGVQLFEVGSGEVGGAEVVLDSVAGGDGFAGFRARAGGSVCVGVGHGREERSMWGRRAERRKRGKYFMGNELRG